MTRGKKALVLVGMFLLAAWNLPAGALGTQIDLTTYGSLGDVYILADGSSATLGLEEDGYSLLQSDPASVSTDPGVSITSDATWLSFYYDFVEGDNSDTVFSWWLTDADGNFLSAFYADMDATLSGLISLDLSAYIGQTLGITFQIMEYAMDASGNYLAESVATINKLQLTATRVPEPGTCILLGAGLIAMAGIRRKHPRVR